MVEKRHIPLYDLTLPARSRKLVDETLKSGWLTTGKKVTAFEREIARRCGVRYGVATNSGTSALLLALGSLGVNPGAEIVTTPFSFVATAEAIYRAGAQPVMADIDPNTLTIDPDEVARKITKNTVAIVPVDIAGFPCDYSRLKKVSEHFTMPIITDGAHSFGTLYRKKPVAKWVDAAALSFHATKNLTCGEGGMLVTRHKALADNVRLMSLHGLSSSAQQRARSQSWKYDVLALGFKANMSDILASVGLGQLENFEKQQEKRRKIARHYIKNLSGLEDLVAVPSENDNAEHAWHLFIIRLHLSRLRIGRDRFIRLMKERGIGCGVHYQPLFELTLFQQLGLDPQFLPNATYAGRRVVSLPMYPHLKLSDVDYVCEAVRDIVTKHRR